MIFGTIASTVSKLSSTVSHANNYSNNRAIKWHLNISGINWPINRKYRSTFHATIFCLFSNKKAVKCYLTFN